LQSITELWHSLQYVLLNVGGALGEILTPIIDIVGWLVDKLEPGVGALSDGLAALITGIKEGKPVAVGIAAAVTAWALATYGLATAQWIATAATGVWTAAIGLLNAAFLASPIGWIVLGIGLLVAGVVWAWNTFEGFRNVVISVGTAIKDGVLWIVDKTIGQVKMLAKVLWSLVTLDFAGAQEAVKEGMGFGDKPLKVAVSGPITPAAPVAPAGQGVFASAMPNLKTGEAAPGAVNQITTPPGGAPPPPKPPTNNTKASADAIATGGSKTQNFNISIAKLIGIENFENTGADLDTDTIQDKVLDAIMRALNMSQSLAQ